MCRHPVGGYLMGDDDDRHIQCVSPIPTVSDVKQRPSTDQRTDRQHPGAPMFGAFGREVDVEVRRRGGDGHVAVLQPIEQLPDGVVLLGDIAVQRHHRLSNNFGHTSSLDEGA